MSLLGAIRFRQNQNCRCLDKKIYYCAQIPYGPHINIINETIFTRHIFKS